MKRTKKASSPPWWYAAASAHAEADMRCGRPWSCNCGPCRVGRGESAAPSKSTAPLSRPRERLGKTTRALVVLEVEILRDIDNAAAREGITRGAWIRKALHKAWLQTPVD